MILVICISYISFKKKECPLQELEDDFLGINESDELNCDLIGDKTGIFTASKAILVQHFDCDLDEIGDNFPCILKVSCRGKEIIAIRD